MIFRLMKITFQFSYRFTYRKQQRALVDSIVRVTTTFLQLKHVTVIGSDP